MADELGAFNFFKGFEPTSMMKSGETWVKGTQYIFMTFAETAKTQMQEATESLKAGMSAKTLAELGDIQSKLAKDAWHNSSTNAAWLVDEFKALAERTMATAKGSGAPDVKSSAALTRLEGDEVGRPPSIRLRFGLAVEAVDHLAVLRPA